MHLAESMIEAEKEIELETLQKIAACFEKGDGALFERIKEDLQINSCLTMKEFWLFQRMQAAAKLAEDEA